MNLLIYKDSKLIKSYFHFYNLFIGMHFRLAQSKKFESLFAVSTGQIHLCAIFFA